MGLRVRIPPRAGMSLVIVVWYKVEVSSSGWLLFQRSRTEYTYVCLSVILKTRQWGEPGFYAMEGKNPCCRLNRRLGGPKRPFWTFCRREEIDFYDGIPTPNRIARSLDIILSALFIHNIDWSVLREARCVLCDGGSEFLRIKIRWMSLQMVGIRGLWNIIRRCWMNFREGHLTVRCSSRFFAIPVWAELVILLFIILMRKSYVRLTDFQYWHTVDYTHYAWYRSRNWFGNFGRETSGPVVSPHCVFISRIAK